MLFEIFKTLLISYVSWYLFWKAVDLITKEP